MPRAAGQSIVAVIAVCAVHIVGAVGGKRLTRATRGKRHPPRGAVELERIAPCRAVRADLEMKIIIAGEAEFGTARKSIREHHRGGVLRRRPPGLRQQRAAAERLDMAACCRDQASDQHVVVIDLDAHIRLSIGNRERLGLRRCQKNGGHRLTSLSVDKTLACRLKLRA
jgi:hypothetical protein